MIEQAGFINIVIDFNDKTQELINAWDPENNGKTGDYIVSANIQAVKPLSSDV